MKVGSPADKPPVAPVATGRTAPGEATSSAQAPVSGAGTGAGAEASAKVQLSSTAASLLSGVAAAPEFDAPKVERVTRAIAEGSYRVNAEVIADKLIANAQELLKGSQ